MSRLMVSVAAAEKRQREEEVLQQQREAVETVDGPLLIVSDSTYVVHCFRDGWWEKWLRKGWVSSKREPVANREIWEPLIEAVRSRGNVDFRWVKGHSGDRWNDEADRLAVEACSRQVEISG